MKLKKLPQRLYLWFSFSTILIASSLFITSDIYAKVMTPTGLLLGTVRVNICGDNITDGPEQCDRNDLGNKTCADFGFEQGNLSCGFTCEWDISNCGNVQQRNGNLGQEENGDKDIDVGILRPLIKNLPSAIQFLKLFDNNTNGIIESSELPVVMLSWVNAWKYSYTGEGDKIELCDFNKDDTCNIEDFSIVLYYLKENSLLD
ncbi:MAG: hypothetical protein UR34_C0019G0008 [candidate division WS6 bacterium GW2011_GWC1_33_20]|uniref:Dockerin domain-containing protein n=2 Tax=Candidatus Dojkabacteria TaxID=74243 RepID=A0A0G0CW45_9BACT|nr:MAG: hypothetical protein UR32_C0006G0005 [candidate division WS6 bacterium GW2011_GWE2_33_157]KKP43266.1 MAG: hypothetical protein UR34_C0019G0008 [candidate division WS6 bacterium GW2011_GWC1_33_20]KKP45700.1 MAG: hypothetical protein UR36_C0005G0036 [candidate division WS6 bacterium GW2011_GWF1_33_233]KKP53793.1 MAG: hypothetical protein UR45_C0025G0004 [candidate division WS6 bacterium GW2011_WS6_33_547]KKP55260.1 MAG: hypothetical protein UR47_C0003G0036 [candidate division WS6 bacteriu